MSHKIYAGNLSFNMTEETLQEVFEKFGDVLSCKIITDRETGRSKGFGFIEMATSEGMQEAISNLDGTELEGRNIRVNEAKPQERKERNFGKNRW